MSTPSALRAPSFCVGELAICWEQSPEANALERFYPARCGQAKAVPSLSTNGSGAPRAQPLTGNRGVHVYAKFDAVRPKPYVSRSMNPLCSVWLGGAWLVLGCTSNPYYIGSACPPGAAGAVDPCHSGGADAGAGDTGVSFALDLDQSGASHLGDDLELPGGMVRATLRLRGERATATDWPTEQGTTLSRGTGTSAPGLDAPFTDATLAVGLAPDAPTYVAADGAAGSIDGDDAAIEVVLRTAPGAAIIAKIGTATGWSLDTTPAGELSLDLRDAQRTATIVSEPLAPEAWYHCLFWVSRSSGGRCDCNGRPGMATDLTALGSVASSASLVIGGAGTSGADRVELAHLG